MVRLQESDGAVDAAEDRLVQRELHVNVAVLPVAVQALLVEVAVLKHKTMSFIIQQIQNFQSQTGSPALARLRLFHLKQGLSRNG